MYTRVLKNTNNAVLCYMIFNKFKINIITYIKKTHLFHRCVKFCSISSNGTHLYLTLKSGHFVSSEHSQQQKKKIVLTNT